MKKQVLGSVILLTVTSSALAFVNQTWSGFYAGVNGGYGWGSESVNQSGSTVGGVDSLRNAISHHSIPGSLAGNPGGGIAGIEAGYNYGVNDFVVIGAIADYDWAQITASQTVATQNVAFPGGGVYTPATSYAKQTLKWFGTLRVLAGLTPRNFPVLAYLTGGFGYGNVYNYASYSSTGCAILCGAKSSSNVNTGWVIGGGLAYPIYPAWSFKAEYLYYNLGTQSQKITNGTQYLAQNTPFQGNIVRFGVDYSFM